MESSRSGQHDRRRGASPKLIAAPQPEKLSRAREAEDSARCSWTSPATQAGRLKNARAFFARHFFDPAFESQVAAQAINRPESRAISSRIIQGQADAQPCHAADRLRPRRGFGSEVARSFARQHHGHRESLDRRAGEKSSTPSARQFLRAPRVA